MEQAELQPLYDSYHRKIAKVDLPKSEDVWLETHRADLIARTVAEEVSGRRRMLLCLVSRLPFGADDVRIDLLNFCFDHAPDCRCHRWRKRVEHHLAQRDMEFAQQLGIMAAQLISQFDTQGTAGSRLAWLQGVVETEVEQVDAETMHLCVTPSSEYTIS